MLFNSLAYLALLVGTVVVHWSVPGRWRPWVLLLASVVFYASWSVPFLALIAGSTTVDFVIARALGVTADPRRRRWLLATAVTVNLTVLAAFKYAHFFLGDVVRLLTALGFGVSLPVLTTVLPLGISFYTFEAISYAVDVYRGQPPVRSYRDYALYILFFPHLIAGPIVRSGDFLGQLAANPRLDAERVLRGLLLIAVGLVGKCDIADNLAPMAELVFTPGRPLSSLDAWMGLVAFSFQLFADFASYTAIARGSALLVGIVLPANFDAPYLAPSITTFWRRWHRTLSSWLRDYLYVPLGGSRHGPWQTARNLLITMGLGGLWHGASWLFVAWGLVHGVLLVAHRAWRKAFPRGLTALGGLGTAAGIGLTFLTWTLSLILFRAPDVDTAANVAASLAGRGWHLGVMTPRHAVWLTIVVLGYPVAELGWRRWGHRLPITSQPVWAGMLLGVAIALWALFLPDRSPQFLYFQF